MAEKFNPEKHLIQLKGKDYLQVQHRVMWFKDTHPKGQILTEVVSLDPVVMKATVTDNNANVIATGHGSAMPKANAVWSGRELEKAETAAVGRALGLAGFGTQFTGDFADGEDDYLADSPTASKNDGKSKTPQNRTKQAIPDEQPENGTNTRRVTLQCPMTVSARDNGGFFMTLATVDGEPIYEFDFGLFETANYCYEGEWRNKAGKYTLAQAPDVTIYETVNNKGVSYWRVKEIHNAVQIPQVEV